MRVGVSYTIQNKNPPAETSDNDFIFEFNNSLNKDLKKEIKDGINESIVGVKSNAEKILVLLNVITDKIKIVEAVNKQGNTYYYQKNSEAMSSRTKRGIMTYAMQLIYQLRTYITGEEIIFHIGYTRAKGITEDAYIRQRDVLKNLNYNSKEKAIKIFQNAISQYMKLDDNKRPIERFNQTQLKTWSTIENLADVSNIWHKGKQSADYLDGEMYQKEEADQQVFIQFKTNKVGKRYYVRYYRDHGAYIQFNKGWLWEWYESLIQSNNQQAIENIETYNTLKPLFRKNERDTIPGTNQGDVLGQNIYNNKQVWVQNKFNNNKILSESTILGAIKRLKDAIEKDLEALSDDKAARNAAVEIENTFLPVNNEKTVQEILEERRKIIELLYK